jgi:hypothetical protein
MECFVIDDHIHTTSARAAYCGVSFQLVYIFDHRAFKDILDGEFGIGDMAIGSGCQWKHPR